MLSCHESLSTDLKVPVIAGYICSNSMLKVIKVLDKKKEGLPSAQIHIDVKLLS